MFLQVLIYFNPALDANASPVVLMFNILGTQEETAKPWDFTVNAGRLWLLFNDVDF